MRAAVALTTARKQQNEGERGRGGGEPALARWWRTVVANGAAVQRGKAVGHTSQPQSHTAVLGDGGLVGTRDHKACVSRGCHRDTIESPLHSIHCHTFVGTRLSQRALRRRAAPRYPNSGSIPARHLCAPKSVLWWHRIQEIYLPRRSTCLISWESKDPTSISKSRVENRPFSNICTDTPPTFTFQHFCLPIDLQLPECLPQLHSRHLQPPH